jgi:hypothetical protein
MDDGKLLRPAATLSNWQLVAEVKKDMEPVLRVLPGGLGEGGCCPHSPLQPALSAEEVRLHESNRTVLSPRS